MGRLRIQRPPRTGNTELDRWAQQVGDAINFPDVAYGQLGAGVHDGTHLQAVTNSYSNLTGWEDASCLAYNSDYSSLAGYVTARSFGTYFLNFSVCGIGKQNTVYEYRFGKNGSELTLGGTAEYGNTTGIRSLTAHSIVTAADGDQLSIMVEDIGGTSTLTIHEATFTVQKLGL